jgi:DtxR family transcriptional regulator, Mn-dependent transcriptional regulator
MVDRIAERLGNPERCPHGWPVDPEFEQRENNELAALADLAAGTKATIVRLAEHDGELLHWFYDQGLEPGRELELQSTEPFAVRLNGGKLDLSEKAAAGLFVRPS